MKGIFFSTILFFFTIFLVMFISSQRMLISFYSSQKSVENRINSMIGFYESIVFDSKKSMEIIGRRAISAAINYIISNGQPLNSSNNTIVELMLEGTLDGVEQGLMESSTIRDWKNTIEYLGGLQGFKTDVSIEDMFVQQSDSFYLLISYSIFVNISDTITQTNISKSSREQSLLSIENLEDPIYPLSTYGRVVNVIRKSPHWMNYSSEDLSNLIDDLEKSYYHPSLYGASFLDRLEGKYFLQEKYAKENPVGLESFVNKDKILLSGLPINISETNIDYLYFSRTGVLAYSVSGMPQNFRLDNETSIESKGHLQIYNVSVIE
ncbi:MAG: hypothetical protein QXX38_01810 [Candidatus Aenigmatarchaeota archaeon]